jgi:lipopolysaccharide/colanic/teichoic acid biosynthesis glycosyltransferase
VRYISLSDLLNISKVVAAGELMTATVLFSVTRLEGIPRSVPAIHALILGAGLIAYRGVANRADKQGRYAAQPRQATSENVILIGLNDWSVLFMKYLQAQASERPRVTALLDENPRWIGRWVNGVQVLGPPAHLEAAIEEFAAHGVRTDWVVVGGEPSEVSGETLAEMRDVCTKFGLDLVFLPRLSVIGSAEHSCRFDHQDPVCFTSSDPLPNIQPSPYFRFKRLIDAVVASILILTVLPLLVMTALIVLLDVGWPVWFWQQRVGRGGRELQLYKLRTLRPPFDREGQRVAEEQRLSGIGRLLRLSRLDELPQLLNVLVGDMSLVGPRPLLLRDQPPNSARRLTVRPGITGWAQVNGGILLSATEKDALDIWYISNASLWLDLRIIAMTFVSLLESDRRCDEALAQAMHAYRDERRSSQTVTSSPLSADTRRLSDAGQRSASQPTDLTAALLPQSQATPINGS